MFRSMDGKGSSMLMTWTIVLMLVATAVAGAIGGLVNAFMTDNGFAIPRVGEIGAPGAIVRPGVFGNIGVGAVAAAVSWGLYGPFARSLSWAALTRDKMHRGLWLVSCFVCRSNLGWCRWREMVDQSGRQQAPEGRGHRRCRKERVCQRCEGHGDGESG